MNENELIEQQNQKIKEQPPISINFDDLRKFLLMLNIQTDTQRAELIFYAVDTYRRLGASLSIEDANGLIKLVEDKYTQK